MTAPSRGTTVRGPLLGLAGSVIAVVIAGCASVLQGDGGSGNGATDQPGSTSYDHASGAEDVLVSIKSDGGYTALRYTLSNTAEFALLGDGTAVVPGPMIEIFPGPAINRLQSKMLTEQQIQDLYAAAAEAGLLDGALDFGEPGMTDQAVTTVQITVGGRTVSQSAYALGSSDDSNGLTEAQIAAREALQTFIDTSHATVDADTEPYVPTAIAAFRLDPAEVGVDPELTQPPLAWPIATVPPPYAQSPRSCAIVSGEEAAQLNAALAEANELTPWLIDADPPAYFVFRPLLPDDFGCEQ